MKKLLRREQVNPYKLENAVRAPLSYAVTERNQGGVKILLAQEEAGLNKPDDDGRTPLNRVG